MNPVQQSRFFNRLTTISVHPRTLRHWYIYFFYYYIEFSIMFPKISKFSPLLDTTNELHELAAILNDRILL